MSTTEEATPVSGRRIGGLERAVERYGRPAVRRYTYRVGRRFFDDSKSDTKVRVAEVIILLRRRNGNYLVHTKAFYPEGVYRLMSGGIKPGEDLLASLRREAREETGLCVRIERFLGILHYEFIWGDDRVAFASYLFLVGEMGGVLRCNDAHEQITGFREVTLADIASLARQLEALPEDWADWGRFRAAAHRMVVEGLARDDD